MSGGTGPARLRVLVIEDEVLIGMLFEEMLADLGCELVAVIDDLDRAVQAVQAASFDVVLLDINLDGARSFPVADALRARGLPFAFVTGYGSHAGGADYADVPVVQKPFSREELGSALEQLRRSS